MKVRGLAGVAAILAGGAVWVSAQTTEVKNTLHNLSSSGPGRIVARNETDECIFCHGSHDAGSALFLWNHELSEAAYSLYSSSTLTARPEQPGLSDSSTLCLSCHDGTVPLGATRSRGRLRMAGTAPGGTLSPSSSANLNNRGLGLQDDHPIAVRFDLSNRRLRIPPTEDPVELDEWERVQCSSCHEAHVEDKDPVARDFLVMPIGGAALCQSCHQLPEWPGSSHQTPPYPTNNIRYDETLGAHLGYRGVAENACSSCHVSHSAPEPEHLLKAREEALCLRCHDGSVATGSQGSGGLNIQSELLKIYSHPVTITPSQHDASEGATSHISSLPELDPGRPRHAECVDCHNPHGARSARGQGSLSGALAWVWGISDSGGYRERALREYEICFKCHGDSANKPQQFMLGGDYPQRQTALNAPFAFNTRLEFQPANPSYHPLVSGRNVSVGLGGEVPSLRRFMVTPGGQPLLDRPLGPSTRLDCTDCHNNDTGRNLGDGSVDPRGPHGSNYRFLLERRYELEFPAAIPGEAAPGALYSMDTYALCDKCHDVEGSVLRNESFPFHAQHVMVANASCATCHAPHGVVGGTPMNNSHLIDFDTRIVAPNLWAQLRFDDQGYRHGACSLRCHGVEHQPAVSVY